MARIWGKRVIWRLLTIALLLMAGACAGPTGTVAAADRLGAPTDTAVNYQLGVGDRLRVTVFNEAALSGEFALGPSGTVAMPLIGEIPAAGKTPSEVAAAIQAALANGYLRDPKVAAEVTAYRPYYILGEVKSPGTYPYVSGLTVLNAVAIAQGFTPRANQHVVFIRRLGADQEVAYKVSPDLRVFPGDTVRLGERYF
jgi:polysaccharide biosynthesis/export protein